MAHLESTAPALTDGRYIVVTNPRTGKSVRLVGRAATFVLLICQRAADINALRVGKFVLSFIDRRIHPFLQDTWQPVKDDDEVA